MDLKEFDQSGGRRHPWEVARAEFFRRLLRRRGLIDPDRPLSILDIGAGDGYVAERILELAPGARIVCYDPNYSDAHLRALGGKLPPEQLQFTRTEPAGSFDLILCLDVLEHVPDDHAVLRRLVEHHLSTGSLLVSVPAWPSLYTRHDLGLGHYRRYTPGGLRRLLQDCELDPVMGGGLFHALVPLRAFGKLSELLRRRSSHPDQEGFGRLEEKTGITRWQRGPVITAAVRAGLAVDNLLSRAGVSAGIGWKLPGLTLWALCRRATGPFIIGRERKRH